MPSRTLRRNWYKNYISHKLFKRYPLIIKRLMDIGISLFIIIVFLPIFVIIACLIKLTSPGPILYKQERVGFMGQKFQIYKFRTMFNGAHDYLEKLKHLNEADGPVFHIENDPRITKIGKFLRKSGFDEFPQLINILKTEMTLVGPRPPLYKEMVKYKPWHLRRLTVKPGLTCLWQIQSQRHKIKFDEWIKLDCQYIDNWSLSLDFKILLKTVNTIIKKDDY